MQGGILLICIFWKSLEIQKSLIIIAGYPEVSARFEPNPEIPVDFYEISKILGLSCVNLGSEMPLGIYGLRPNRLL